jgi:hypothetical protein
MGTQADEIEVRVVRLAINQNDVRPDMAVAMVRSLVSERMSKYRRGSGSSCASIVAACNGSTYSRV